MNKTTTLVAAGIALIVGTASLADDSPEIQAPPAFAELDTDGDLQINRDEFEGFLEQGLSGNGGRVLFHTSRQAGGPLPDGLPGFPGRPAFADIDTDGDTLVTEEEFQTFLEERAAEHKVRCRCTGGVDPFGRADTDGDGMLSQDEYGSMAKKVHIIRKRD
jgi:hypothetical protein